MKASAAWKWLAPLSIIPLVALLTYGFRVNPRDIPSPLVGRPAAEFALRTFDGQPVSLDALRGKIVALNIPERAGGKVSMTTGFTAFARRSSSIGAAASASSTPVRSRTSSSGRK